MTDLEQMFFPDRMITVERILAARGVALFISNEQNARVEIGDEVFFLSVERAFTELGAAIREIQALGSDLWAQKSSG